MHHKVKTTVKRRHLDWKPSISERWTEEVGTLTVEKSGGTSKLKRTGYILKSQKKGGGRGGGSLVRVKKETKGGRSLYCETISRGRYYEKKLTREKVLNYLRGDDLTPTEGRKGKDIWKSHL